jgi:hypothetical protein
MGSKHCRNFDSIFSLIQGDPTLVTSRGSKKSNPTKIILSAVALLIPMSLALTADAGSTTFVRSKASIETKGSHVADLMATWKETGLIPGATIQYELHADAAATFICETGGAVVSGPTVVSGSIASVFLATTSLGWLMQSAWLDEINGPSCGGATRRIVSVEYDSPEICDLTNGICQSPGGPYAQTFCDPAKPAGCPAT